MSPNYYDTSLVPFFVTWILGIERHNQNIIQTCKTGHPKPIFNSDKYFFFLIMTPLKVLNDKEMKWVNPKDTMQRQIHH